MVQNELLVYIFSAMMMGIVPVLVKLYLESKNSIYLIIGAICFMILIKLYTIVLANKNIGLTHAMISVSAIIGVVICGIVFFHESITTTQILGIILCIVGILLLKN